MKKLSDSEVKKRLAELDGWTLEAGSLCKEFKFANFAEAMKFMNRLALVAERLNHHPDWSNSYNKVQISLTTHSEGGLTGKDFQFAAATNKATQREQNTLRG